jgi:hypothetical protein
MKSILSYIGIIIFSIACALSIQLLCDRGQTGDIITPGKISVRIDSVIIHDTTQTVITRDKITVVRDTVYDESGIIDTSIICYGAEKTLDNGGFIDVKICSKELPAEKPIDLLFQIDYKAGNDTIKTRFQTDTTTVSKKQPIITSILEILIGFLVGGIVAIWATH